MKKDKRDAAYAITKLQHAEASTLYTFICDSSGSMSGTDYGLMMQGVETFLKAMGASAESKGDKYSMVLFGRKAELVESEAPINKLFTAPPQWRDTRCLGTDFNKAFEVALNGIKVAQARKHVVILMTDGAGEYGEIESQLADQTFLNVRQRMKAFQCFTVGYGPHFQLETLEYISRLINSGETYKFVEGTRIDYVHSADAGTLVGTVRGIADTLTFEEGALKRAIESMEKQIKSLEKACADEKAQKRAQAAELDKLKG